jgi:DNA (cytosine-5)-methyltransferase 1
MPNPFPKKITMAEALADLPQPTSRTDSIKEHSLLPTGPLNTHEHLLMGFSPRYLSRNRVRGWKDISFTIQATGRHIPLHPQAPRMIKGEDDSFEFVKGYEHLYRRLSVRECARIQTFPDTFKFCYDKISTGYKMVGNAVPVELAYHVGTQIKKLLD